MWISRDIEERLKTNSDPIQVIRGPRQCGKMSLVLHLDPNFRELSLDDPSLRQLAQDDPEVFLQQFPEQKLFIDEAQYAPNLFPTLKRHVDLYKRSTVKKKEILFRLTGSNQILMDRHIKESLAGRASFFDMNTLSVSEILNHHKTSVQQILYKGGWPELYTEPSKSITKYLDDYINTYVERDIILSAGIQKQFEFLKFVKLLAGRVGQLLDLASLGRDLGVDAKTIKEWVSVLERMKIIALAQPYFSNRSSRLVKAPKVFFIDTGLACRLQGWSSAEPILTSPHQGPLFENLVFSEIYKTIINYQLGWEVFHWRSRDKEEIDFLIDMGSQKKLFIESKMSFQQVGTLEKYREVQRVFKESTPPLIHCHMEGERVLAQNVPIAFLKDYLLRFS